jgi:hypothetical protein
MSTVDKSRAAQKINYTIAGSAAVSLASLYFNATKIGRIANSALVLSIAARVLAGNVESTQGEFASVAHSQPSFPVDVREILNYGISAVKAVHKAAQALHKAGSDYAIRELAKRDAAREAGLGDAPPPNQGDATPPNQGNDTTSQNQGDAPLPNQGTTPRILVGIPVSQQVKKKPTATKSKNTMLASLKQLVKKVTSPSVKMPTLGCLTKLTDEITKSATKGKLITEKPNKVLRERKKTVGQPTAPDTEEEEQRQIEQATQASLEASPRVECPANELITGTKNQYELLGGNTACTSIAGTALIAMLTGKLVTPEDIDHVLQAGVGTHKRVLNQLNGSKTDAGQTQLLGWDQCYHGGFKTVLQTPEAQDKSLEPASIALSSNKNCYLEALQTIQQKAIDTETRQGAILIMQPFTYAVSITPLKSGPVIQLFDSHGSLAYDVLGGSNPKASIASFTSVEQLAEYLNAQKPYDPDAQTPERNQFGLYMCQLRSEAQSTTTTTTFSGNDAELTPEEVSAQRLAKVIEKLNGWEQGFAAQIEALRNSTDNSQEALEVWQTKLTKTKERVNQSFKDAQEKLPEHTQVIGAKLAGLREKLGEFEQLLKQRSPAQPEQPKPQSQDTPAPTDAASPKPDSQAQVVPKPQQENLSKYALARQTEYLKSILQGMGPCLQRLQTETQSAENLDKLAQGICRDKDLVKTQSQLLNNASNPQEEIQPVLDLCKGYGQKLSELEKIIAQKLAVQSAASLEELLNNQAFITTSLQSVSKYNADALVYLEQEKILFLKQEIPRLRQIATELQAKAEAFPTTKQSTQQEIKFKLELKALQTQLAALQEGLEQMSSQNSVQTTTITQPLKELQEAPTKHKALIAKWIESIEISQTQFATSPYRDSPDFLAALLGKVNPLHDSAKQLHQSITALQQNQKPLKAIEQLLEQIQRIITDAANLSAQIKQKQAAPPSEPAEQPPAPTNKNPRNRIMQALFGK